MACRLICCGMQDHLVVAGGLIVVACRLLSCSMHVGSSSLTRDRTQSLCIGSMEFYPLDHQGSPSLQLFNGRV